MKTKNKLICLDLDGTLLNDVKDIPDRTKDYLNFLSDEGEQILIATGRHLDYADYLTRELRDSKIIVSSNGAVSYSKERGIISKRCLESGLVEEIVRLSRENSFYPNIYYNPLEFGYDMIVTSEDQLDFSSKNLVRGIGRIASPDMLSLEGVLSVTITSEKDRLDFLLDLFKPILEGDTSFHIMMSTYTDDFLLEIMAGGVSKWSGIEGILGDLGISKENTIAFGDDNNDYEMLKEAGKSFVMKNSRNEKLLSSFKATEMTNNEDGIYYELKRILDGKSI